MNHQSHNFVFEVPVLLLLLPLIYGLFIGRFWDVLTREKRLQAFVGLLILVVGLLPEPTFFKDFPMSFHMLRHILLLLIFPPIYLSVIPVSSFRKFFHSGMGNVIGFLRRPVIAYLTGMSVMLLVNLPMLRPGMMHTSGHVLFEWAGYVGFTLPGWWGGQILLQIIAGIIYSFPVFIPMSELRVPGLQKIIYLFLSCVCCSLIGLFITLNPELPSSYIMRRDIQASGLLMWVPGCLVYIAKSLSVLYHFFHEEQFPEELPVFEKLES